MQIDLLLANISGISIAAGHHKPNSISGITTDPCLCRPGFLYVAAESETVDSTRYGVRLDGRQFISDAIKNGATSVLTTPDVTLAPVLTENISLFLHQQPLAILGSLCARFYGEPKPKHIALVTGTNGKTSTVNFCRMLWTQTGHASCSVGNLGGVVSDGTIVWDRDPALSVPETVTLHKILHTLGLSHVDYVAMEATSHALYDYRLNGVPASIGAFTNLTRDHLDFHKTMEEYFRVKMMLFRDVLPPGSCAVLNADDDWFESAASICREKRHRIIAYGSKGADVQLIKTELNDNGQMLSLKVLGRVYQCQFNLFGQFQLSNMLCSLSIVIASGIQADQAIAMITALTAIEGRLNIVAVTPSGGKVVIDYAHTPDGIRAALEACRTFTPGNLIVVFGCNGDRDAGKRPEMGELAARLADQVIVTDGHPRGEDSAKIRREILSAAPGADEIDNRKSAIEFGIKSLSNGDTLLIAGMGHETFQQIGEIRLPHSDTETARHIVGKLQI